MNAQAPLIVSKQIHTKVVNINAFEQLVDDAEPVVGNPTIKA